MLSSNVNDHSPDSRHRSANSSPKCAALDLPPRRIGLYSARVARQLLDSAPGKHGRLTIVLSARKQELWLYYALMATIGSVIGGYVTYRLARKGGKETLERKFPARTLEKVYRIFGRWGFGAIAIAALLPPPVPMVPFLFAAGAMQYSVGKFLVALAVGRVVRYSFLAFLAAQYGRQVLTVMSQLGHPVLITVIGLIAAAIAALIFILVRNHNNRGSDNSATRT